MESGCIFCQIIAGSAPASFVYEDTDVVAFLDTMPVTPGHTLVIPRRHAAQLADLDPEDGARIFKVAQQMGAMLRRSGLRCEAVTLHLADGIAASQDVFHVHLHVIPRFEADGFSVRHPPGYGTPIPRADLDAIAARIKGSGGR
jgi:diadenosine tetraphosphate (Ap4A) HIT family hydrolase